MGVGTVIERGRTVHVRNTRPSGWVGTVRSLTGTTYTIVAPNGARKFVDYTRQEVTAL